MGEQKGSFTEKVQTDPLHLFVIGACAVPVGIMVPACSISRICAVLDPGAAHMSRICMQGSL